MKIKERKSWATLLKTDKYSDCLVKNKTFLEWLEARSPEYNWRYPHIQEIIKNLEQHEQGLIKNLMVLCPPQHGKSELLLRYLIWRLERNPKLRAILASYNLRYASTLARKARRIAIHGGALQFRHDAKQMTQWELETGGSLLAVGVQSGVTGNPADIVLLDDLIKGREDANSPVAQEALWNWFVDELSTRLSKDGQKLLVMTPWSESDIRGKILDSEDGKNWTVVKMPALSLGEDEDLLHRPEGEPLCPELKPKDWLEDQRAMNPHTFESLFQCNPRPREGALFRNEWFHYVAEHEIPQGLKWVRTWDLAVSIKTQADFSACALIALAWDNTIYIKDVKKFKLTWPELAKVICNYMDEDGIEVAVGVEEFATQLGLVQDLFTKASSLRVPLIPLSPKGDKLEKASVWASRMEFGKVKLVRNSWNTDFISECLAFPQGKHDDQIDAVSLGISLLIKIKGGAKKVELPQNPNMPTQKPKLSHRY